MKDNTFNESMDIIAAFTRQKSLRLKRKAIDKMLTIKKRKLSLKFI